MRLPSTGKATPSHPWCQYLYVMAFTEIKSNDSFILRRVAPSRLSPLSPNPTLRKTGTIKLFRTAMISDRRRCRMICTVRVRPWLRRVRASDFAYSYRDSYLTIVIVLSELWKWYDEHKANLKWDIVSLLPPWVVGVCRIQLFILKHASYESILIELFCSPSSTR